MLGSVRPYGNVIDPYGILEDVAVVAAVTDATRVIGQFLADEAIDRGFQSGFEVFPLDGFEGFVGRFGVRCGCHVKLSG